jgi:hypothetical protein
MIDIQMPQCSPGMPLVGQVVGRSNAVMVAIIAEEIAVLYSTEMKSKLLNASTRAN